MILRLIIKAIIVLDFGKTSSKLFVSLMITYETKNILTISSENPSKLIIIATIKL